MCFSPANVLLYKCNHGSRGRKLDLNKVFFKAQRKQNQERKKLRNIAKVVSVDKKEERIGGGCE